MQASDANEGGVAEPERPVAANDEVRSRVREAMLMAVGKFGYRRATVQDVVELSGGSRAQFDRYFVSRAACYQEAYEVESERLCEAILSAGRAQPSWRTGLEAGLTVLAAFAIEQPALARGLLVEIHLAGLPALRKRREVFERLSRAIDSARRETKSRHSLPPLTAMFIVHVIDAAMANVLVRGTPERFEPGELAEMASLYYEPIPPPA